MTRKKKDSKSLLPLPSIAPRQKQLPGLARLPKANFGHARLFSMSNKATPITERGKVNERSSGDTTQETKGFVTTMEIPLPPNAEADYGVTWAALRASGTHRLGANELRIFLATLGLAASPHLGSGGSSGTVVYSTSPDVVGGPKTKERRDSFEVDTSRPVHEVLAKGLPGLLEAVRSPHIITIKTTIGAIAEAAGLKQTHSSTLAVMAGLRALADVKMRALVERRAENGKLEIAEKEGINLRFLSFASTTSSEAADTKSGKIDGRIRNSIEVSFDPMITDVLSNLTGAQFSQVYLEEARSLEDVALILHNRLCSHIDPGKSLKIRTDTLVGYVYAIPDPAKDTSPGAAERIRQQIRKMRLSIRKALTELESVGWGIVQLRKPGSNVDELYEISRPSSPRGLNIVLDTKLHATAANSVVAELDIDEPSLFPSGSDEPY